jgi:hypothetical protein
MIGSIPFRQVSYYLASDCQIQSNTPPSRARANLRKPTQAAVGIPNSGDKDRSCEPASVLAEAPALLGVSALGSRNLKLHCWFGRILWGVEQGKVTANDLVCCVALQSLRSLVPRDNDPLSPRVRRYQNRNRKGTRQDLQTNGSIMKMA